MRISIMQPYFLPYLGYFRLLATDLFVIYDCVQFPRRGWVHRNRLENSEQRLEWLTLPLAYAPQDATIASLAFAEDARAAMAARIRPFRCCTDPATRHGAELVATMMETGGRPVDYIVGLLRQAAGVLGVLPPMVASSGLALPSELRAQDRILAICEHFGASEYLNAPGGRGLYDQAEFARRGIQLTFLPDFRGNLGSVLQCFHDHSIDDLRRELGANMG